jgi:hypothetical protein
MLEVLNKNRSLQNKNYIQEALNQSFNSDLCSWRPHHTVMLQGYWQHEAYFHDAAETLRSELSFREMLPNSLNEIYEEIIGSNAVAVHVRKMQYSRTLSIEYYRKAMSLMITKLPNARFYFFSDDPKWTQCLLDEYPNSILVSNPTQSGLDDFRLMTLCRHFIIANSSFSWWAAWLGEKENSILFKPDSTIWKFPESLSERWITILNDQIK